MEFSKELFGKILRETRNQKGMTAASLAEKINKEVRTVNRMESGERCTYIPTLLDICNALEVTPNHLLGTFLINDFDSKPTSYEHLMRLIPTMDTEEVDFVLNIVKNVKEYKKS